MTIDELRSQLAEHGVRPDAYCLTGGLPNEAYTIEQAGDRWRVYYSEKGTRTGLREFLNESDACEELFRRVLRDESAHDRSHSSPKTA